jgi:hypothetical protein
MQKKLAKVRQTYLRVIVEVNTNIMLAYGDIEKLAPSKKRINK